MSTQHIQGGSPYIAWDSNAYTWYFPIQGETLTWSTTTPSAIQLIASAGTISALRVYSFQFLTTAGKSIVFTLYKNGIATDLTVTMGQYVQAVADTTNTVSVSPGDYVYLEAVANVGSDAIAPSWCCTFTSTTAGETLFLANDRAGGYTANNFCPVMNSGKNATEFKEQLVVPCAGTLKNFYAQVNSAPDTGKSFIFTARNNGTGTSLVATISGTATTANDTANTVSVSAGDLLSIQTTDSGSPAAYTSAYFGFTFVPATSGSFVIGTIDNDYGITGNQYRHITGCGFHDVGYIWVHAPISACTVKSLYVALDAAPGAGKNLTYTLQKNGANQALAVTISESATAGNASADVALAAGDTIDSKYTATAGASAFATVSYLAYVADPSNGIKCRVWR